MVHLILSNNKPSLMIRADSQNGKCLKFNRTLNLVLSIDQLRMAALTWKRLKIMSTSGTRLGLKSLRFVLTRKSLSTDPNSSQISRKLGMLTLKSLNSERKWRVLRKRSKRLPLLKRLLLMREPEKLSKISWRPKRMLN
jgi:hypothetical protein